MVRRFKSTIIVKGTGEFLYLKVIDNKYPDNPLVYELSNECEVNYLLNSLNDDIVELREMNKPLHIKILNKVRNLL